MEPRRAARLLDCGVLLHPLVLLSSMCGPTLRSALHPQGPSLSWPGNSEMGAIVGLEQEVGDSGLSPILLPPNRGLGLVMSTPEPQKCCSAHL